MEDQRGRQTNQNSAFNKGRKSLDGKAPQTGLQTNKKHTKQKTNKTARRENTSKNCKRQAWDFVTRAHRHRNELCQHFNGRGRWVYAPNKHKQQQKHRMWCCTKTKTKWKHKSKFTIKKLVKPHQKTNQVHNNKTMSFLKYKKLEINKIISEIISLQQQTISPTSQDPKEELSSLTIIGPSATWALLLKQSQGTNESISLSQSQHQGWQKGDSKSYFDWSWRWGLDHSLSDKTEFTSSKGQCRPFIHLPGVTNQKKQEQIDKVKQQISKTLFVSFPDSLRDIEEEGWNNPEQQPQALQQLILTKTGRQTEVVRIGKTPSTLVTFESKEDADTTLANGQIAVNFLTKIYFKKAQPRPQNILICRCCMTVGSHNTRECKRTEKQSVCDFFLVKRTQINSRNKLWEMQLSTKQMVCSLSKTRTHFWSCVPNCQGKNVGGIWGNSSSQKTTHSKITKDQCNWIPTVREDDPTTTKNKPKQQTAIKIERTKPKQWRKLNHWATKIPTKQLSNATKQMGWEQQLGSKNSSSKRNGIWCVISSFNSATKSKKSDWTEQLRSATNHWENGRFAQQTNRIVYGDNE